MQRIIAVIEVYILFIFFLTPRGFADGIKHSPFRLTLKKETILTISSISFQQAGNHFLSKMTVPDPTTLNSNTVNNIDSFACKYYSKKMSYFSDNTKDATTVLLALTFLPHFKKINRDNILTFVSDIVLFLETESIIVGMTKCAKGLSKRPRPFVYNSSLSLEKRRKKDSYESFWSGHASLAFATAVFTGYVYQNRHPGSRLIVPVWICGISCATATSIFRIRSGNHFPSDVIVGAAVGSLTGWFIPRMHKENHTISLTTNVAGTAGLGILYHY